VGGHGIPSPKLICIGLQPYTTTQAPERTDVLADDTGLLLAQVVGIQLAP